MGKRFVLFLLCFTFSIPAFSYVITGRVLDQNYFPVPVINIYVNGTLSGATAKDGTFIVNVDKLPYDITLVDQSNLTGVLYKNLTILNPELTLFGELAPRNVNSEYIKVEFPALSGGK